MKGPTPPTKRSLLFLAATPVCATAMGAYRAWRALSEPKPLPVERVQRDIALGLTAADEGVSPWRWLATHHRSDCIGVALLDAARSLRLAHSHPGSPVEMRAQADEVTRVLDGMSEQDLARRVAEAAARRQADPWAVATSTHPLVDQIGRYQRFDDGLLNWLSREAYGTAVEVAFEATMRSCAAAADKVAVGEPVRVGAVAGDGPGRPPYDRITVRNVVLGTSGLHVDTEASSSLWQGMAAVYDDLGNEYLFTSGRHDVSSRLGREKARVRQRFYPAMSDGARELRLLINPWEPDESTVVVRFP